MRHMTKPSDVPSAPLPGGGHLPLVGLGTWKLRGDQARAAVSAALAAGYRHIEAINLGNPTLIEIAAAHRTSTAQVVLGWHLAHGIVVIPKSARPDRIAANIDLFGFELADAEVAAIDALSRALASQHPVEHVLFHGQVGATWAALEYCLPHRNMFHFHA
jgi:diketogulonate reductase-like aldo/keto reductase